MRHCRLCVPDWQEFREWYNAGGSSFVPTSSVQQQVAQKLPSKASSQQKASIVPAVSSLAEARVLTGLKACAVAQLQDGE